MQNLHHKLPFLHEYSEILLKDTIIWTFYCFIIVVYTGIDLLTILIDCVD